MSEPSFFNIVLLWPIINVLVFIYKLLITIGVPYALGFSIILLTIVIRLLLYPLTTSQLKTSQKMQELSPHLSRLKEKHKGDSKRVQEETMKLYKEHGINPAAGCIPMLIQLPFLWGLYSVLAHIVSLQPSQIVMQINKIVYIPFLKLTFPWDQYFFGIPLGKNPSQLLSVMPLLALVPVVTALLQYIQSKMMLPVQKEKEEKKPQGDDFSSAFQTQSLYIFPLMIGFFSYSLPIGLSLYWNTITLFGILQQHRLNGFQLFTKMLGEKNHEKK